MTQSMKIGRRGFLLGQAALVGSAGVAGASVPRKATWENAISRDFKALKGETVKAVTADGTSVDLIVANVERAKFSFARPMGLPRSEGITVDFKSPQKAKLVEDGDQNVSLSHPTLGKIDAYLSITPRRSGDHDIELILG